MSKAFDYVCHNRLLAKLYRYGIRGPAFNWIRSYLENRMQCVETARYCPENQCIQTYRSTYKLNKYGVPQGSILGPLLFLLYINDLPKALPYKSILFADDTSILIECTDPKLYNYQINNALHLTVNWLHTNNLKVNIKKTKVLQFHTTKSKTQKLSIKFNNEAVEEVKETLFLGINIDSQCNWKSHIESVCTKVNRFVFALRRLAQAVSKEVAVIAYNSYVCSRLRYGIVVWGNSVDCDRLFIVQKRCLRAIFGISRRTTCKTIFKQHKLLTLPCLYIMEVCSFVHKNKELFKLMRIESSRQLRSKYNYTLVQPPTRLALCSNNSYIMCTKIYNKLPDRFKDKEIIEFKEIICNWLNEKCFYSINEYLND